jgi:hypothetical protein
MPLIGCRIVSYNKLQCIERHSLRGLKALRIMYVS